MAIKGAIQVYQLSNEINKIMKQYSNGVGQHISVIAEDVAKRGAKKLKLVGDFGEHRNRYRKGWRAKNINGRWVVHNATDYRLTHLLERGHAMANGGRARAFPHIKTVEQEMIEEFEREIKEVLSE